MNRKAKSKSVHVNNTEMKYTEDGQENNCVVCFKGVDTYSIGQCDHPVCFECSTRMRVLCKQNECPICRQEIPLVHFVKTVRSFKQLVSSNILTDKKYKIEFENEAVRNAYVKLLEHSCPKCTDKTFSAFHQLQDHVRRVHQLNYCDLCVENLKIFTFERRVYTRHELVSHRRAGDADDKSHKGHPICEFCDVRYMDSDELFRHLRRDHLYCHFCDADGFHRYYNSYGGLRDHFGQEHYLCEEGECSDEQFTSVFRTEIDLKAHKATAHGRLMGKVGLKQARTLELEFTLTPRQRASRNRNHHNRGEEEESQALPYEEVETVYHQAGINTDCIAEFPCLGGSSGGAASSNSSASGRLMMGGQRMPFRSRNNITVNDENFPVLGNPPPVPPPTVNVTVSNGPPPGRVKKPTAGVSIHVRSSKQPQLRKEDFPALFVSSNFPMLSQSSNFPALSSNASTSTVGNPQWSEPKPKPVSQPQPKPPPKPTFSMDTSQFPSLSLGEPSSTSSSKKSKKSKNKSSQPQQTPQPQPPTQPEVSEPKPAKAEKSKKKQKDPDKVETKQDNKPKSTNKNNDNNKQNSKSQENKLQENKLQENKHQENKHKENKHQESKHKENKNQENKHQENKTQELKQQKNKKEKKKSENKIETNGETNNNIVQNGDRLGLITEELMKMPPPGFGPPPPPGFGRLKPPPGLPPPGFALTVHSYLMPRNFAKRNKKLITEVVSSVGEEYYEQFKKLSSLFRNNVVSAQDYVEHCSSMMGRTAFDSLFPELLALLPEINKQQELWNAMDDSTKRSLDLCDTCRQVLTKGDLADHLAQHAANLDNPNFPPLPSLLPLS